MQKEEIRKKLVDTYCKRGLLYQIMFLEFFKLLKLKGFDLDNIFVLSEKKAGRRTANHIKKLLIENLSINDI